MFLGTPSFLPKIILTMGRSGVKAAPSPRSFKPFWSSDDQIDTTRGKRRRELPQNRQKTSSGASAAADGGSPFRWRIVAIRHDPPLFEPHFNHPKLGVKKSS